MVRGDLLALPVPDASVDRVMASEVLEHIPDDVTAMAEIARVLKPGGRVAVTVPRYGPERICWALSDEYHANEGGHIRIYRRDVVRTRLASVGLVPGASHHAHALHAPFWWLKCAVGVRARLRRRPRLPPAAGLGPHRSGRGSPAPPSACSTRSSARAWSSTPTSPRSRSGTGGSAGGGPSEWERTAAAR